jgi:hypothetical protein
MRLQGPQNAGDSVAGRRGAIGLLNPFDSALNAGFNLQTVGNGKGEGGTCSGDSGGPVF